MIKIKKCKKIWILVIVALLVGVITATAWAADDYGAAAVTEGQTYTLEQILTHALEDEYLAYARYQADIEKFGEVRPFVNIVKAEKRHINLLMPLFDKYSVTIPDSKAAEYLSEPETLLDALNAGVEGETSNIRMYDIFLNQELPNDVRISFALLKSAAEKHLDAFKRNVARIEQGTTG